MNKALGQGTNEPGLHVSVTVVPSLGRYLPGRDTPVYGDNAGPHCYPVPFSGVTLHDRTSSSASSSTSSAAASASTGPGGTPLDSELVREVAALQLGRPPATVPAWSSLLVGPLYQGATVDLR